MAEDQLKGPSELPIKCKYLQSLCFFLTVPIKNLLWVPFSSNFRPNHVLQLRIKASYTSASHLAFLCAMKTRWRPHQFLCGILIPRHACSKASKLFIQMKKESTNYFFHLSFVCMSGPHSQIVFTAILPYCLTSFSIPQLNVSCWSQADLNSIKTELFPILLLWFLRCLTALNLFTWMDYLKFHAQFPVCECYILNY